MRQSDKHKDGQVRQDRQTIKNGQTRQDIQTRQIGGLDIQDKHTRHDRHTGLDDRQDKLNKMDKTGKMMDKKCTVNMTFRMDKTD